MNKKHNYLNIIPLLLISIMLSIGCGIGIYSFHAFQTTDCELYYYGLNRLSKYDLIIGHIQPVGSTKGRRWYGLEGFSLLRDNNEFFFYKGGNLGSIVVDSLCSYGFNDHTLVTEVITDQGIRYYYIADFNDFHNSVEIQIDTSCITNPITFFNLDKWIYEVNHPPKSLCEMSDFCICLLLTTLLNEIILLSFFVVLVIKIIKVHRLQ